MSPEVSERSFEEAIECGLLQNGPDACAGEPTSLREPQSLPYGDAPPGGYRRRRPEDYDRALCLVPRDAVDFILATQPKEWQKLAQHHGAAVKEQFLKRLAAEIERRGALDRAGTCIDPKTQIVDGKTVCVVSCQRSPEPVFLKWKGMEASPNGDFFVRSGPGTVKLPPDSASEYVRTRFPAAGSSVAPPSKARA
jgi:hypothetical protein